MTFFPGSSTATQPEIEGPIPRRHSHHPGSSPPTFISKHSFGLCSSTLVARSPRVCPPQQETSGWRWLMRSNGGGNAECTKGFESEAELSDVERHMSRLRRPDYEPFRLRRVWFECDMCTAWWKSECFLIPGNRGWGNCHICYFEPQHRFQYFRFVSPFENTPVFTASFFSFSFRTAEFFLWGNIFHGDAGPLKHVSGTRFFHLAARAQRWFTPRIKA